MISRPSRLLLRKFSRHANEITIGAGKIIRRGFSRRMSIKYKGRIDPVTEFDLKSEAYIVGKLRALFPDHDILTEEGSDRDSSSDYRWIIDPLDGTVNYSHGFPFYCVSIALQYQGESIVGTVYDPERDELFHAIKGGGARLNRRAIIVSDQTNLERALLATGFSYNIATARRNNLGLFERMSKKVQGIRRAGSAAIDICWVACGRLDGYWEMGLKPWDTAAASLIANEAGAKISRINGRPFQVSHPDLLAANSKLHRSMRTVLSGR